MLLFDIGANRGDATLAGLEKGYDVIAIEAAPKIFKELISNFIYNERITPLKFAVSDTNDETIDFYECVEDGLSTIEKKWLTDISMPYNGKDFKVIKATTITIDRLVELYGKPELIKIDVEGAEWSVFKGMTSNYGKITFEWTESTLKEHQLQLQYLQSIGYTEVAPQFIVNHLEEPDRWYKLKSFNLDKWINKNKENWISEDWKKARLRPTADVGMIWVK